MTLTPSMHLEQLKSILRAYHDRIKGLEDKKYDIEYIVKRKDVEVQCTCIYTHTLENKTKPKKKEYQYQNQNLKKNKISYRTLLN